MRFLLAALLTAATPAFAVTFTVTANTNWSALSPTPTAADTIIVKNGRTLTVNVANGTVGQITLGGGNPSGGQGTLSFNAGSAVTISSASGQSGLLILGGGGNAGNLNMNSGGTLTLAGFTSTTVGTFTRGSGTIVMTGTNTLPSAAAYATYNNLSVSANTTTLGQNTTVAGNLNISGGTLNTSTRTLSVTGTTAVTGTLTLTNTTTLTGALTVNSGGTLSITSATGNKTFGAVTINTGGTWNSSAGNVFLGGNFTNNGTFTSNLATYTFNGGAAQGITGTNAGSTSFAFLTINNTNGVTLTGTHDVTVTNLLTFVNGKLTTGTNLVYVPTGSTVSGAGAGKFIEGNLKKQFDGANLSRLFEIGGNSGTFYSPVSLTFAGISAGGDVTVSTTSGLHPQLSSSGLDDVTPKLLNRYWTVTNNGVTFTTYGASFSYDSSEIDAAATASTFLAVRYASAAWNPTTLNGTPTTTTLLITNETGFGDFAIGNTGASSGTIGRFNAYDPPPVTPSGSITGNIRTKTAGVQFTLTIVHLDNKGTGLQNMNDNITVDLLDGSPTGGTITNNCSSNWTTVIATVAGNISGGNNSTTVNLTVPDSWRDVRVRVTRAGGGEIGCSTDNFAIRPASITVVATDGTWQTAGTTRTLNDTSGIVHAASTSGAATPRPFTLTLTAFNGAGSPIQTTNYAGTATLKSGSPACAPASCTTGTLSPTTFAFAGGTVTTSAHYSEAGNLNLEIEDATFADVDTADTAASVRTIPQAGSPPLLIGRFVPDRFVLSGANTPQLQTFGNSCGSRSFTYVGQPFWFVSGLSPSATLTAVNAGGGTTTNYVFAASKPAITETFTDSTTPAAAPLSGGVTSATSLSGTGGSITYTTSAGSLSYTRSPTTPVVPFNAAIVLSVSVTDATETNATNGTVNITGSVVFNSGPSAIAFDSGNELRYGVVRLVDVFAPVNGNASGKAPVGIQAQYWTSSGFVTNAADNCTSFVEKNFVLYSHGGAVTNGNVSTPTAGSNGAVTMGVATLASGIGRVDVTAPPAITSPGNLRICLDLDSSSPGADPDCQAVTPANRLYLPGRWAATGSYDKDPNATIGLGVFGAQPRNFILFRENY